MQILDLMEECAASESDPGDKEEIKKTELTDKTSEDGDGRAADKEGEDGDEGAADEEGEDRDVGPADEEGEDGDGGPADEAEEDPDDLRETEM